jgi:V-type H+-transporting ATPase subunit H
MSGDSSLYAMTQDKLLEDANNIRSMVVNWRSYHQSQMISNDDFEFINQLDSATDKQTILDKHGKNSAKAFVNLIGQISRDQTVRYLLTMIDDLLTMNRENIYLFHQFGVTVGQNAWAPFMTLLSRPDQYISCQASRITAKLASWGKLRFSEEEKIIFFNYLIKKFNEQKSEWLIASTSALLITLRVVENRKTILEMGVDKMVINLLQAQSNSFQLQYQIICCLWLLSFNHPEKLRSIPIIRTVCEALCESEKQKVSRVCLAFFRNILESCSDSTEVKAVAGTMIGSKIQKTLSVLQEQPLDDEEMESDLLYVFNKLNEVEQTLSSFDEYCSEVYSGRLAWSPVHTNNKFWRDNCHRFVEKDYKTLKTIIHILETTHDIETLCVGCHDIGEFVRHYPRGRQVLDKIAAKQTVMQLMTNEDQKVRYNALIAVQKMMVNNWEILGKQIAV